MKPTALLADDEPLLIAQLRDKLAVLWPTLQVVGEAANGVEAAELIARLNPTVAFLDIKMPGLTGIEVAQGIESETRVVFVTAFDQYAVDAFENEALDYVLKPITEARLAQTVERLKRAVQEQTPSPEIAKLLTQLMRAEAPPSASLRWIRASKGDTTYQVPVEEVILFQSDDKYTVVHTANGEYLITKTLGELLRALDEQHFWQVHRGTIVNLRYVASSKREGEAKMFLNLRGYSRPVTVSRAYQHLFKHM